MVEVWSELSPSSWGGVAFLRYLFSAPQTYFDEPEERFCVYDESVLNHLRWERLTASDFLPWENPSHPPRTTSLCSGPGSDFETADVHMEAKGWGFDSP